ncbi:hypothetical protein HD554DRAFT_1808801 [Boletus coccyginus]|nr:hypothetical protein HD554DRAFT_1808801 [Boletus coccyginus]
MDTANPAQSVMAKTIIIKDIKLRAQPSRRKMLAARQYYVQFLVDDTLWSTNENRTWDEDKIFRFNGNDHSALLVKAYQKHRFGRDELVGILTDTIGGILGKLRDGVFEGALPKESSHGSDLKFTIKFALDAEPSRGDLDADERQARDVVSRANKAVNRLHTRTAVVLMSSVVDAGTTVFTKMQTFETTWDVLLRRMELFNKIVTDIAQIHPYASLAWSVISAANQVLVSQKNRDERIIGLAGVMSDVFEFVHDAEPLKAIERHMKAITLLTQQVTECGYFITEYAKQKNFCQSQLASHRPPLISVKGFG